jgi:hypothetical protein
MLKNFFLIVLLLCYSFASFSQNSGIKSTVLLKGRVVNYKTLSPIETKFYLVNNNGKKLQVKSSSDGSYAIPLNTSGDYRILADNWLCIEPLNINIQVGESYYEKEATIYLIPFEPGLSLRKVVGFDQDTKQLTGEGKELLLYIRDLNKHLPKLSFLIKININEGIYKAERKTILEGKKKKSILVTPRQQAEEAANEISESIKAYLNSLGLPERKYKFSINYINEPIAQSSNKKKPAKSSSKNSPNQNLEIIIDAVLNTDIQNSR